MCIIFNPHSKTALPGGYYIYFYFAYKEMFSPYLSELCTAVAGPRLKPVSPNILCLCENPQGTILPGAQESACYIAPLYFWICTTEERRAAWQVLRSLESVAIV